MDKVGAAGVVGPKVVEGPSIDVPSHLTFLDGATARHLFFKFLQKKIQNSSKFSSSYSLLMIRVMVVGLVGVAITVVFTALSLGAWR